MNECILCHKANNTCVFYTQKQYFIFYKMKTGRTLRMKKIVTLLLAAGLVLTSVTGASAAMELKPSLELNMSFYGNNQAKTPAVGTVPAEGLNDFNAAQRFRMGLEFRASESLSAYVQLQSGASIAEQSWGSVSYRPGALSPIAIRQAYMDWMIPATNVMVRMGQQYFELPDAVMGSSLFADTSPAVVVVAPITPEIAVSVIWSRPASSTAVGNSEVDAFFATVPVSIDGINVTPYAGFAFLGGNNFGQPNQEATAWLAGVSLDLSMFNPLTVGFDAFYGSQAPSARTGTLPSTAKTVSGFSVAAEVAYSLGTFGTPAIKGWYTSGTNKDGTSGIPSFGEVGGVNALSWFFDGAISLAGNQARRTTAGTLGAIVEIADVSFVNNLDHTLRFGYIMGTDYEASSAAGEMGTVRDLSANDSLMEIDFVTSYAVYENLAANLELAYVIPMLNVSASDDTTNDGIFFAALTFVYNF